MRSLQRMCVVFIATSVALHAFHSLAFAQDTEPRRAPKTGEKWPEASMESQLSADLPPSVEWKQILATPRIGGRLTSVTVDQTNANRIFVGTEEGTLVRSLDGGVTWTELDITPFVRMARSVDVLPPPKPTALAGTVEDFKIFIDPPWSRYLDRVPLLFDTQFFSVRPEFMRLGMYPKGPEYSTDFINNVASSRRHLTNPIGRIQVCPGGEYPLLVTTKDELYGSKDDGITFVRLYAVLKPAVIYMVTCSPWNPNDMVVSTFFGGFRSNDGGHTFEHMPLGRGEARVTATAYGPPLKGDNSRIIASAYDFIYQGDPDKLRNRLAFIYPEWANPETAPWTGVWWIETTKVGAQIWMGTDDGIRVSRNDGVNWTVVARALFSNTRVEQVAIGANEQGGERIAALSSNWIYATDDYGKTWFPYFYGITRRAFKQIATAPAVAGTPPRWWVVAAGGLFATVAHTAPPGARIDRESARWATEELRTMPSLPMMINAANIGTHLDSRSVASALKRMRFRNFIPRIDAAFTLTTDAMARNGNRTGMQNYLLEESENRTIFTFFLQGIWEIRDTPRVAEEMPPIRNSMYEIRRHESYIIEDAWHERKMHLLHLAEGMDDPLQIWILKERIEALDTVLELWIGKNLKQLYLEERKNKLRSRS